MAYFKGAGLKDHADSEKRVKTLRKVLAECGIPRATVAADAGLGRATLEAWLAGKRSPQPENLRKLAAGLRKRALAIRELADEIDRYA